MICKTKMEVNYQSGDQELELQFFLWLSPRHVRMASLVLNPETVFASAQFYVKHDEFINPVKLGQINEDINIKWQILSCLSKKHSLTKKWIRLMSQYQQVQLQINKIDQAH